MYYWSKDGQMVKVQGSKPVPKLQKPQEIKENYQSSRDMCKLWMWILILVLLALVIYFGVSWYRARNGEEKKSAFGKRRW